MTQTLDAAEGLPQLDPTTQTQASTLRTFAITFGIAFTLLYTVYERLNWPLFTYQPRTGTLYFWLHRPLPAEGPPMYWSAAARCQHQARQDREKPAERRHCDMPDGRAIPQKGLEPAACTSGREPPYCRGPEGGPR